MLNDLIEKISAQTGLPAATVQPVVGALLAHLSDILPPPLAHMLAVSMGIHQEPGQQASVPAEQAASGGGLGGLLGGGGGNDSLGGLLGGLLGGGGGAQGSFAGAGALASVAESLLGGLLSGRR